MGLRRTLQIDLGVFPKDCCRGIICLNRYRQEFMRCLRFSRSSPDEGPFGQRSDSNVHGTLKESPPKGDSNGWLGGETLRQGTAGAVEEAGSVALRQRHPLHQKSALTWRSAIPRSVVRGILRKPPCSSHSGCDSGLKLSALVTQLRQPESSDPEGSYLARFA